MMKELARSDLHSHFDGSFTTQVLTTVLPKIDQNVFQNLTLEQPVKDLGEFFRIFDSIIGLIDSRTVLLDFLRFVILEAHEAGIEFLDCRFGCGAISKKLGFTEQEILIELNKGFEVGRILGMDVCPTLCFSRHESEERCDFLTEFVLTNKKIIRAVDLEGDSTLRATRDFAKYFRKLKDAGLRVTIHAGEFAGPEQVWQALDDCGAERIGHGYTIVQDKELLKRVVKDQIPIEVCLTSNYLTGVCQDLKRHPIIQMVEAGVPVVLCTDDQGIFKTSLINEYQKASGIFIANGLDPMPILRTISANSKKYHFRKGHQ